jgi:hypothetical protein
LAKYTFGFESKEDFNEMMGTTQTLMENPHQVIEEWDKKTPIQKQDAIVGGVETGVFLHGLGKVAGAGGVPEEAGGTAAGVGGQASKEAAELAAAKSAPSAVPGPTAKSKDTVTNPRSAIFVA